MEMSYKWKTLTLEDQLYLQEIQAARWEKQAEVNELLLRAEARPPVTVSSFRYYLQAQAIQTASREIGLKLLTRALVSYYQFNPRPQLADNFAHVYLSSTSDLPTVVDTYWEKFLPSSSLYRLPQRYSYLLERFGYSYEYLENLQQAVRLYYPEEPGRWRRAGIELSDLENLPERLVLGELEPSAYYLLDDFQQRVNDSQVLQKRYGLAEREPWLQNFWLYTSRIPAGLQELHQSLIAWAYYQAAQVLPETSLDLTQYALDDSYEPDRLYLAQMLALAADLEELNQKFIPTQKEGQTRLLAKRWLATTRQTKLEISLSGLGLKPIDLSSFSEPAAPVLPLPTQPEFLLVLGLEGRVKTASQLTLNLSFVYSGQNFALPAQAVGFYTQDFQLLREEVIKPGTYEQPVRITLPKPGAGQGLIALIGTPAQPQAYSNWVHFDYLALTDF